MLPRKEGTKYKRQLESLAVSEAMLNDELANDIETDEMQSVTN